MSVENSFVIKEDSAKPADTVEGFCKAHHISRSKLYQEWEAGTGPDVMRVGVKILISKEAAARWRRSREGKYTPALIRATSGAKKMGAE